MKDKVFIDTNILVYANLDDSVHTDKRGLTIQFNQCFKEMRGYRKKYHYSYYDSLIIAAALEAGCSILYSEDMQDNQKIGSLTIRNPLK